MKKALLIGALTLCTSMSFANAETLKFGTEATFAPFEFTDDKANIIGYDVDIIKAIGEAEGFDVQVVNMPFDSLIPSVLTAQLDGAIAGISITEERAKQVSFSDPYYKSGISAIVRKADAKKYTVTVQTGEGTNKEEKTFASYDEFQQYLNENHWQLDENAPGLTLAYLYAEDHERFGTDADCFIYIIVNAHWEEHRFALPVIPAGFGWHTAFSSQADIADPEGTEPLLDPSGYTLAPRSSAVLIGRIG